MDLCHHCDGFAAAISQKVKPWPGLGTFWDAVRIRSNSHGCRLCRLLTDYLLDDLTFPVPWSGGMTYKPCIWDEHLPMTCIDFGSLAPEGHISMSVWCEPESPAALAGAICTQPALPSDNCPEAFTFIKNWIQDCSLRHKSCQTKGSGVFELPTRVLDVGARNSRHVYLKETDGELGNYCALSYCWGPKGSQTLFTTKDKIDIRFQGIHVGRLPKTLQDAVTVTQEIGVRYLWIDSLCIIQDDQTDWARECSKMAATYRRAYLVIAASGAAHAEEGCFSKRRRSSVTVDLPYYTAEGVTAGSFKLSIRIPGCHSPEWGPLAKRGWALQERYLARRALHFMPGGLFWKCNTLETDERTPVDMGQYNDEWEDILQAYSGLQLAYQKDRLPALEGLSQSYHWATPDDYYLGVFKSKLPDPLLWMMSSKAEISEDRADLPDWCWASKGGRKVFLSTQREIEPMEHGDVLFKLSDVLLVDGLMAELLISGMRTANEDLYGTNIDLSHMSYPLVMIGWVRDEPFHVVCNRSNPPCIVGVAAFDREHFESVHFVYLAQWNCFDSIAHSMLRSGLDSDVASSENQEVGSKSGSSIQSPSLGEPEARSGLHDEESYIASESIEDQKSGSNWGGPLDSQRDGESDTELGVPSGTMCLANRVPALYLGLLLTRSGAKEGCFRRVGMGFLNAGPGDIVPATRQTIKVS